MTKDEILSLASTKFLQYKIPIGVGLIVLMFTLKAYDSKPEPTNEFTPVEEQSSAVSKVRQTAPQQHGTSAIVGTRNTQEATPPVKKEIPTWLPISEGALPGRTTLTLDSVEYNPIEGVPNHPERIYANPDCVTVLSKTALSIEQVNEFVDGEYIPCEVLIKEKAENSAMLEKNIPDTTPYSNMLPLDAVIIE